jgi:hypothetical protein
MDLLTRFKSKRANVASDVPLPEANEVAVAVAGAEAEALRRAEEVQVCDVGVEISTEPSGASEMSASPMETTQDGGNGRGTLSPAAAVIETTEIAVEIVETERLARLKKFDTEWEKLERRSPAIAELCEQLLAEGAPGAADQIGTAGRRGVSLEVCQQAAELWRTDNPKNWSRARDMLII